MAFDTETRNRLARLIKQARELLVAEFTQQFQEIYGIQPDGAITGVDKLTHLDDKQIGIAKLLRERIGHLASGMAAEKNPAAAAIDRALREQAFTILNRFAALRLCEERGLVEECVRQGLQSKGFKVYETVAGAGLGGIYERYKQFLLCLFDEIAVDLGVLFDRFSPHCLLFPREPALQALLDLLNDKELRHIWTEDETIGWIYQYFNPPEERKKMREESAAPRNSRELAVRNQFFTPRYVVEFLTDNTLGRIWYEMQRGNTELIEKCHYLVRRPMEIFLGDPIEAEKVFRGGSANGNTTVPDRVAKAFQGDLSDLPDGGPDTLWIALAIPPDQFEKYTGIPWERFESGPLDAVLEHIEAPVNPEYADDVTRLWMALSHFRLTDSGSPYGHKPFRRLWEAFVNAVEREREREGNLTQEELLRKPVYIPHRLKKDPRDLKVLDPACGSGHFMLYAFDLLGTIYQEAWQDRNSPPSEATGRTLREDYASVEEMRRAVPELVLRHNLHGIDIDPRAVQIAALALWLRAQKSWQRQGIKAAARPRIIKSNIVTAEPMPGEADLRREFVESLQPKVIGQLVNVVFDKMQLAGEAGSLLKIEEEIQEVIAAAKRQWLSSSQGEQMAFAEFFRTKPKQEELRFDVREVTDEDFWQQAEDKILAALREHAEQVDNGRSSRRRLFAEDTVRGFAFVDLCQKRFDVVLMNPPFGEGSKASKAYLGKSFPDIKYDLFAMFVFRWLERLCKFAILGSITNKTGFFLQTFEVWRQLISTESNNLKTAMDLGFGVLDTAVVETMAYTIQKTISHAKNHTLFFRLTNEIDKQTSLERLLNDIRVGEYPNLVWLKNSYDFQLIPHRPMCYWASKDFINLFITYKPFAPSSGHIYQGIATGDNFRFLRCRWEAPVQSLVCLDWVTYAKGGTSTFWYSDFPLMVLWKNDGSEIKANAQQCYGSASRTVKNEFVFYKPGLTYTQVTIKGFFARALPAGCIFDMKGPSVLLNDKDLMVALGIFCSLPIRVLAKLITDCRQWHPTNLMRLPYPIIQDTERNKLRQCVKSLIGIRQLPLCHDEGSGLYYYPVRDRLPDMDEFSLTKQVDDIVAHGFGVEVYDFLELDKLIQIEQEEEEEDDPEAKRDFNQKTDFISYAFGCTYGRWDVRILLDSSLRPKLSDPFDPLPVCPPGMLIGPDGLPANPASIVSEEWLRARPNAITLPPEGSVKDPTIPDSEYPLRLAWSGILVDDPGINGGHPHQEDIIRRVREVLEVLWVERAHDIEQEACKILGVNELRDYFCRPAGFFQDHLKLYSKSRRKAPIYWPLSTASGSYTLWLYYHRLTDQTLFACVTDYVDPKLASVQKDIEGLKVELARGATAQNRQQLEKLQDLAKELQNFREELLGVAALPYKPNLNDGVLITAAPLWKLFRHNQWRKDLQECWQKLMVGDYDWAHLAYAIWPDRVKVKCKTDRSLAIAHNLEELYQEDPAKPKKKQKKGKS